MKKKKAHFVLVSEENKLEEEINLEEQNNIYYFRLKDSSKNRFSKEDKTFTRETKEMMLETVRYLNHLKIDGIKIHMLHILKDTPLETMYKKEKFHVLTKEEYIDIVVEQLEYLRKEIVIHRITGDPKIEDLVEPNWLVKKFCVLNDIDKEMVKRDTYQGKRLENESRS